MQKAKSRAKAIDMATRWPAAWAVICALSVVAGCASSPPQAPPRQNRPPTTLGSPFEGAATLPPADTTNDGPGSLVEVKPLGDISYFDEVSATGVRVVYRSTDSKGKPTAVSGVVVVPPGNPPRGGWPILSFGHEVTGVLNQCAPSLGQDLGGYASVIAVLVTHGYVVTMTDYQGLGLPDFDHSVLDATTLGNNMIDAVRAARRVVPSAGNRWAAYGTGQGGMAAWGATEQAGNYGAGLDMVGAVAFSPLADVSGWADAAANGTLTPWQYRLYMLALDSLSTSPDFKLNLDDYRTDVATANWGALTTCQLNPITALRALTLIQPSDLKPKTAAAVAVLRGDLKQLALPRGSLPAAPLLVIYATEDPLIPPAFIEQALKTACARGDSIEVMKRVGDTNTLTQDDSDASLAWLSARFDGQRLANICVGVS